MIFVIASGYSFRVISHHEVSLLLRDAYFRSIRSTCLRCFAVEGKRTEADGGGESKDSRICTRTAATGGRKDGFQARKGRCHVCSAAKGITLRSLKRTFLGAFRVFGSVSLYLWWFSLYLIAKEFVLYLATYSFSVMMWYVACCIWQRIPVSVMMWYVVDSQGMDYSSCVS